MGKYKYDEVKAKRPTLEVMSNANDVVMTVVSSMCDNIYYFKFVENEDGRWSLRCTGHSGMGQAFGNFGIKCHKSELEWAAADGDWPAVVNMINSGYQLVADVKSHGPRAKACYAFMFREGDPADTSVVVVEHESLDGACVQALKHIGYDEEEARRVVAGKVGVAPRDGEIYSRQVDVDKTSGTVVINGWDHYLTF